MSREGLPEFVPDDPELFQLMGLLSLVEQQRKIAVDFLEGLRDFSAKKNQLVPPGGTVIETTTEDEHIPAAHLRIAYAPVDSRSIDANIAMIVLRIPDAYQRANQDLQPNTRWNDVFIEVWGPGGESQNYLLNSKGLTPFDSANEDIYMNYEDSRDRFEVHGVHEAFYDYSIADIYHVLNPQNPDHYPLYWQHKNTRPQPKF